jgi:hypothetical protein
MAAQTRLSVALYVHCLSCLICGPVLSRLQLYVDLRSFYRQKVFYIFIRGVVFGQVHFCILICGLGLGKAVPTL